MLKMMLSLFGLLSMSLLANDGGDGDGDGDGADTGGQSGGDGATGEGAPSTLEADAQAAIEQLKAAGQEIPEALSKAVKELSDARKEAAGYRTGRNELRTEFDNLKTGLAKALGLENGETPDPEKLQTTLADREATIRRLQVTDALTDLAAARGVSRKSLRAALLDAGELDKLDPSTDDFKARLEAAADQAVEEYQLAATPGGGRGPGQGPRSTGPHKPDMDALLRAAAGR